MPERMLGVASSKADIDSGTITGASITATNASLTTPTITTPTISGGNINNTVIGSVSAAAATVTALTATTVTATSACAFGSSSAINIGFYGAAGTAQRQASAMPAVATTAGINSSISSSCFGFTSAQCQAIIALVNELRATAVALGLVAN